MTHDMLALTLAVVGRTLFGADLRGDVGEMGRSLGVALEGFRALGYIPLGGRCCAPRCRSAGARGGPASGSTGWSAGSSPSGAPARPRRPPSRTCSTC